MTLLYTISHVYLVEMDDNSVFSAHATEEEAHKKKMELEGRYPQETFTVEKVRVQL